MEYGSLKIIKITFEINRFFIEIKWGVIDELK